MSVSLPLDLVGQRQLVGGCGAGGQRSRYGSVHAPKTTKPSPSEETVAHILPVSSETVMVHPRPSWPPWMIRLPFRCSTFRTGDWRPSAPECTFIAFGSTLRNCGKFTAAAVRRLHSPSGPSSAHSKTTMGTHRNGTDPSYLPAAGTACGAAQTPTAARTRPIDPKIFIRSSSAHRVAAARHARAEGLVVARSTLGHGVLLLRGIAHLLLLFLLRPPV